MASRLRAGVIGCGFFSPNHVAAWRSIEEVELAALCDRDRSKAQALALPGEPVGIFDDAERTLRETRLDFVDIVTTQESHRPLVELCATYRVPAIVQKPMAPTFEDAQRMVEAMAKAGRPFMVHENFRFQVPIAAVREVIDSGRIGRPTYAHIAFRTGFDIYANQPYLAELERFILMDVGVHVLDVARFLLGEADRVFCQTQSVRPGLRGEDMATATLHHANGATSVVECSYASTLPQENFPETLITVEGDRGSVQLRPGYRLAVRDSEGMEVRDGAPPAPAWAQPPWQVVQDSVYRAQLHWVECLRSGREPATSGRDNLRTLALVEAAYRSAALRQAVTVAE